MPTFAIQAPYAASENAPGGKFRQGNVDGSRDSLFHQVGNSNAAAEILQDQYSADASAPTHDHRKARGTYAAPGDVQAGDRVIDIRSLMYSGASAFMFGGAFRSYVDGAFVSGQRPPSRLVFETNLANTASTEQGAFFSNGCFVLGTAKVARGVGEANGLMNIGGNGTVEAYIERSSGDATPASFIFRKSRGTLAAPANINNGDELGIVKSAAYSGGYLDTASIRFQVTNAVTGGQRPPSSIFFYTNVNNAAAIKQAAVFSTGFVGIGTDLVVGGDDLALGLLHLGGNATVTQYVQRSSTDATSAEIRFMKSRGTVTGNTDVASNDATLNVSAYARSNVTWFQTASMKAYVDGAFVSGQRPPSRIEFETNIANTAATTKMVISSGSAGLVGISDGLFSVTERPSAHLHILGQAGDVHMHIEKVNTDANGPLYEGFKARGTVAARANVTDGDATLRLQGFAYSNSYLDNAVIQFNVDGAVTAGQAAPSRIEFYTNASNAAPQLQMALRSNGMLYVGTAIASLAVNPTSFPTDGHIFAFDGGVSTRHLYLARASTANGHNIGFFRSRGTLAALANVVDGDRIVRIESNAYSGATGFWAGSRIDMNVDGAVTDNQRPGTSITMYTNEINTAVTQRFYIDPAGNFGINTTSFGASTKGGIGIGNRAAAPTGNPTAGGVLYAESGALKWRGSGGTTTTIANADPHCPVCGRDYLKEFEHDGSLFPASYFAICFACLADDLEKGGAKPYVFRNKLPRAANVPAVVPKDTALARQAEAVEAFSLSD